MLEDFGEKRNDRYGAIIRDGRWIDFLGRGIIWAISQAYGNVLMGMELYYSAPQKSDLLQILPAVLNLT